MAALVVGQQALFRGLCCVAHIQNRPKVGTTDHHGGRFGGLVKIEVRLKHAGLGARLVLRNILLDFLATLLILVYLSALLTNALNNTTIAAVFVPILIAVAEADPTLNAVQLVLPVTLATTFGYSLPSASGRMALVAGSGIVGSKNMMLSGLIMTLVSAAILAVYFWVISMLGAF